MRSYKVDVILKEFIPMNDKGEYEFYFRGLKTYTNSRNISFMIPSDTNISDIYEMIYQIDYKERVTNCTESITIKIK